jgi:isopenicillin N synthase-like dioxygenase
LKSKRIKDNILQAMAKLLELDEDCLINQFNDKALTYARFNYYPPCPRPDLVLGIKPHSDVFALTVLLMDKDVAGLQVLRDGTWYNVPTVPNYTLLINVGITMEVAISEVPINFSHIYADTDYIYSSFSFGADNDQRDL